MVAKARTLRDLGLSFTSFGAGGSYRVLCNGKPIGQVFKQDHPSGWFHQPVRVWGGMWIKSDRHLTRKSAALALLSVCINYDNGGRKVPDGDG